MLSSRWSATVNTQGEPSVGQVCINPLIIMKTIDYCILQCINPLTHTTPLRCVCIFHISFTLEVTEAQDAEAVTKWQMSVCVCVCVC